MVVDEDTPELDSSITDSWTCDMNKLWTKANKILLADRVERLTCEGSVNEVLQKRNLQEWTANKFKELFASMLWDQKLVMWLHSTLLEHLDYNYKPVYIDSLQILKHKVCVLCVCSLVSRSFIFSLFSDTGPNKLVLPRAEGDGEQGLQAVPQRPALQYSESL